MCFLNICHNFCFSFHNFVPQSGRHGHIDVWPHRVKFNEEFDNTFTLLLQLACVLQMKGGWKNHWTIRIFIVMEDISEYLVSGLHLFIIPGLPYNVSFF